MTFLEIKTEVANRLNLSSAEALTRIGSYINQRYRRLTSSLGLSTSRRSTSTTTTVIGTDTATFSLEKIELVYILTPTGKRRIVYEITYEEYRRLSTISPKSGTPQQYAVKKINPSSVVVSLYPNPDAILTLNADGLATSTTMVDVDTPNIPADFHDALVLGAMADELFKMEKYDLSGRKEKEYEERVSDLRMFIAKSAMISQTEVAIPGGLVTIERKRWQP